MSNNLSRSGTFFNPFPGLRPFTREESHLFFGREGQSKSVLTSLKSNHFVAVIGASGSGKSSLIYCGVIPALQNASEESWVAVTARPGTNPVRNLVSAISGSIGNGDFEGTHEQLVSGALSIHEWIRGVLPAGQKMLLVIDQFEEIFRYRSTRLTSSEHEEVGRFVELIHDACTVGSDVVSVVLTMRSDFIGECSVYQDLTTLINKSNYLVPQMTREDFRRAIEGPVKVGGATIDPDLVEQLLDEIGDNTDQLPVLQHSLMRTWDYWMLQNDPGKPVSTGDYEAIGRMEKALSDHANEAYEELDENQRMICEHLFKTITEKGGDNRGVRRPSGVRRVAEISRSTPEEIIRIADVFRSGSRTFLTPYSPVELNEESVIDISHESLMRIWDRLRLWVDEEASSVQMYRRISEAAALYQAGGAGLWRPPDLQLALNWREKQQPTLTWAVQYHPAFERAMVFLDTSASEFRKEEENKIRLQRRRLKVTRMFSLVLGGIAVIAMGLFLWTRDLQSQAEARRIEAEEQRELALQNEEEARKQEVAAIAARDSADVERERAVRASMLAEQRRLEAERATALAQSRQRLADQSARAAMMAEALAQANADTAELQRLRAVEASEEAYKRRMLSIAKSMAVKSLQIDRNDDPDLKALLAFQAFRYNMEYGGEMHEADVYSGLYDARKVLLGEQYNVFGGHVQSVKSVVFKPGTSQFMSAGSDGRILSFSMSDPGLEPEVISEKELIIEALSVSQDGRYLAVGTQTDGIHLYDLSGPAKNLVLLAGHEGRVRDIVFTEDSREFYSLGSDRQILKWNIEERTSRQIVQSDERFNDIALSPGGMVLAASSRSGMIVLIRPTQPGKWDTIPGPAQNPVISLDFSGDGKYLAAGDQRGNVRLFETDNWTQTHSLRGSSARIETVKFSPNSKFLASSSYDGKVLMWELKNLNLSPIVMEDNRGFVFTVVFSPDEQYLVSGSNNLKSRPVTTGQLADGFCGMVNRNFTREEWELYVGDDIDYVETCPQLVTETVKR
jgi:energy-coupling factor transporter ATP-binding protein EcfA2